MAKQYIPHNPGNITSSYPLSFPSRVEEGNIAEKDGIDSTTESRRYTHPKSLRITSHQPKHTQDSPKSLRILSHQPQSTLDKLFLYPSINPEQYK